MTVVYHEQFTTVKSSEISTMKSLSQSWACRRSLINDHAVHDISFQNHALCTAAMDYTNYLNPGQTVVCSDQPLYALKKTIIWAYPAKFQKCDSCYITNYDTETQITSPLIKTLYCRYLYREYYGVFYHDWENYGRGKHGRISPKPPIFPGHNFSLISREFTRFFLSQMHLPALWSIMLFEFS